MPKQHPKNHDPRPPATEMRENRKELAAMGFKPEEASLTPTIRTPKVQESRALVHSRSRCAAPAARSSPRSLLKRPGSTKLKATWHPSGLLLVHVCCKLSPACGRAPCFELQLTRGISASFGELDIAPCSFTFAPGLESTLDFRV